MTLNSIVPINGVMLHLHIVGEVDGVPDQYDIDLNTVIAKLKNTNTEVFRLKEGVESGLCKNSEISDLIISNALSLLYQEKFEYEKDGVQ